MIDKLMLCNCLQSQQLDSAAIASTFPGKCSPVYSSLCTAQSHHAAAAMEEGSVIVACQQESAAFLEIASELEVDAPGFVDLRDRAGWSDEAQSAGPKQAALIAESLIPTPRMRSVDVESEGLCLVLGSPDLAFEIAGQLADVLSVTVLLDALPEDTPMDRRFDIVVGRLSAARGAFGGFVVQLDALRRQEPGGRGSFKYSEPRDGAQSECDIIIDVRRGNSLFAAPEKREGYLRADPGSFGAVHRVVLEASQLVGTFEKPLYVRLNETLCAHSRSSRTGCTRCLDACSTGAISPAGDHVAIDAMVCAGCGECAAVCPSAAILHDAPPSEHLFQRMNVLATTYRSAGGRNPRLLVHAAEHGNEMIGMCARFGRGLPADVIPLALDAIGGFGHAEMLAALGVGFAEVLVLLSPSTPRDTLVNQVKLAECIGARDRIQFIDIVDPDELSEQLFDREQVSLEERILPIGTRRQVAKLTAKLLNPDLDAPLPLPAGSPYGAIDVNSDACTLCMACASHCPTQAILDNADRPQLRFQEDACIQCGLCAEICPESAIALVPQLNLDPETREHVVLNEEEPYLCVRCAKPFGVRSMIERVSEQLANKHSMFQNEDAIRLMQMCDDCRIVAQYHAVNNPFAGAPRPRTLTGED